MRVQGYVIARNESSARLLLKLIKQGKTSEQAVFPSRGKASKRISQMPTQDQHKYSVYEVKVKA